MKVTISRRTGESELIYDKKLFGLMHKVHKETFYAVECAIQLTEEERAIITKYNLWNYPLDSEKTHLSYEEQRAMGPLASQALNGFEMVWKLSDAIKNDTWFRSFSSPIQAEAFEIRLRTEILPRLKQAIELAAKPPKSDTFEL